MIFAVLASTVADTQTTLLPASRLTLSMARDGVFPPAFKRVQGSFQTPMIGTLILAGLSQYGNWPISPPLAKEARARHNPQARRVNVLILQAERPPGPGEVAQRGHNDASRTATSPVRKTPSKVPAPPIDTIGACRERTRGRLSTSAPTRVPNVPAT